MACSASFHFLQARRHRMFWLANLLYTNFMYILLQKDCKLHFKVGDRYYKLVQILKSGKTFFKNWGNNYKVMQHKREDKSGREYYILATYSFIHPPRYPLEFLRIWSSVIIKRKKKSRPHYRHICVPCKPEKQLIRDVSCTKNCFHEILAKSSENYP